VIVTTPEKAKKSVSNSEKKGVNPASLANLRPWKPGESPNPSGRPLKSRNKLQGDFFRELAAEFEKHGRSAIEQMRIEKPAEFVKVCASLMPRELEVVNNPLDELSDEALEAAIETVKAMLAAKGEKTVLSTEENGSI
jgi:hypothetical protein